MVGIRSQFLVLLCVFALAAVSAAAQENPSRSLAPAAAMPTWLVPVLRLVSSTHVEPTTGIVLPGGRLVLVPLEFASAGDELVVLDGGTDIVRNGRIARIAQRFPGEGLQALAVEGLGRRGAALSADTPEPGAMLRLLAFPPAELISEGKPPLNIEARLLGEGGAIRFETALPNVSGALLDSCGNLAASSAASGVQSMSTTESPRYTGTDDLLKILDALGIEAVYGDCGPSQVAGPEAETVAEPEAAAAAKPEPPAPAEAEVDKAAEEALPEEALAGEENETDAMSDESGPIENKPGENEPGEGGRSEETQIVEDAVDPAESGSPAWLGLAVLAALLGLAVLVYRRRRTLAAISSGRASPAADPSPGGSQSSSAPLATSNRLEMRGVLADGTPFEKSLPVSDGKVDLLIGRGGADFEIASAAVSRRHARLSGSVGKLTISDLGSSNGSSINGVPCLEGETFYVGPGDTVVLGDAQFHIGPKAANPDAGES